MVLLRQIEVFHAFMLTGSTIGAADFLGISQPAVSGILKRMEEQTQLQLFIRKNARLQPTPEAETLYQSVRAVYDEIGHLESLIEGLTSGKSGHIRVGATPALSISTLPRAVGALCRSHPEITHQIQIRHYDELLDMLLTQRLDVAVVLGANEHPLIRKRVVGRGPLLLAFPLEHPFSDGQISLDELSALSIIGLKRTAPLGALIRQECKANKVQLNPIVEVQTCQMALKLAENRAGVAIIDFLTASTADLSKVKIAKLESAIPIELSIIYAREKVLSNQDKLFIDCVIRESMDTPEIALS